MLQELITIGLQYVYDTGAQAHEMPPIQLLHLHRLSHTKLTSMQVCGGLGCKGVKS